MDSNSLRALFNLIYEDKENDKLQNLLNTTVKDTTYSKDNVLVSFYNGVDIIIYKNNLDDYSIVISDDRFYSNDDQDLSKASKDRVCFYLSNIARFSHNQDYVE